MKFSKTENIYLFVTYYYKTQIQRLRRFKRIKFNQLWIISSISSTDIGK